MKQIVGVLVISALSLGCVHTASPAKQAVKASKVDSTDEREVTVKIFGSDQNKPLSSSTFKKDTSGLRTGKLFFDFAKGIPAEGNDGKYNTILVFYAEKPDDKFSISVVQNDVPKGSEIKIGANTIEIDVSKVKNKKPAEEVKTIAAIIQRPNDVGWRIVTGNNDLKKERSTIFSEGIPSSTGMEDPKKRSHRAYQGYPEILDDVFCHKANCRVLIYENKPTRIYAEEMGKSGYVSLLKQADIKKAGQEPIIIIDTKGKARIVNTEQLDKEKMDTEEQAYKKEIIGGLPYSVALKALLLSKNREDYKSRVEGLFKSGAIDDAKVKVLMGEGVPSLLAETNYIIEKIGDVSKWDLFKGKLAPLDKPYSDIYLYLIIANSETWPAKRENQARSLFKEIWKL